MNIYHILLTTRRSGPCPGRKLSPDRRSPSAETPAARLSGGSDSGSEAQGARVAIRRARVRTEGLLGRSPSGEDVPEATPRAHPQAADALAEGHLGVAGLEGQFRRVIREPLSATTEEL